MKIKEIRFLLINCYGPYQNPNANFFEQLKKWIINLGQKNVILLGDLNCVPCIFPPNGNKFDNIDLYLSKTIPNINHSKEIKSWIDDDFLIDKFRILHPNRYDYSFVSPNETSDTMSRLDHILISPNFDK